MPWYTPFVPCLGRKANRDSNNLTGLNGEMPPLNKKPARPIRYVNVGVQAVEMKRIGLDSNSMSDHNTIIESMGSVTPNNYADLQFSGSRDAYPGDSGELMTIFLWTSLARLDDLELEYVIPEPDKKFRLVEAIFHYNGSLVPVFVPSQYAEQRKRHATPPPTPIDCKEF